MIPTTSQKKEKDPLLSSFQSCSGLHFKILGNTSKHSLSGRDELPQYAKEKHAPFFPLISKVSPKGSLPHDVLRCLTFGKRSRNVEKDPKHRNT